MFKFIVLSLILSASVYAQLIENNQKRLHLIKRLERISLASCNKHNYAQPLWPQMQADQPDLFIWGGDNIYADDTTLRERRAIYLAQMKIPDYQAFISETPIIGTWDDHDYGKNNSDGNFNQREQSQEMFLDFILEPLHSARRHQRGIYTSYHFGTAKQKVKIIVLDTRYHMDKTSLPKMILGEEQWVWLENEIRDSDAKINLIVSSIAAVSPNFTLTEDWGDFPEEKQRLLNLLNRYKPSGVLFLTGDKHFGSISKSDGFMEIMSSGFTHKLRAPFRPLVRRAFKYYYYHLHYALLDFDWSSNHPKIRVRFRGIGDTTPLDVSLELINGQWDFAK